MNSVWIYDKIVYEGDFSGKAIGLKEYIEKFSGMEFEILTEGYFGYTATYTGWLWEEGKEPASSPGIVALALKFNVPSDPITPASIVLYKIAGSLLTLTVCTTVPTGTSTPTFPVK